MNNGKEELIPYPGGTPTTYEPTLEELLHNLKEEEQGLTYLTPTGEVPVVSVARTGTMTVVQPTETGVQLVDVAITELHTQDLTTLSVEPTVIGEIPYYEAEDFFPGVSAMMLEQPINNQFQVEQLENAVVLLGVSDKLTAVAAVETAHAVEQNQQDTEKLEKVATTWNTRWDGLTWRDYLFFGGTALGFYWVGRKAFPIVRSLWESLPSVPVPSLPPAPVEVPPAGEISVPVTPTPGFNFPGGEVIGHPNLLEEGLDTIFGGNMWWLALKLTWKYRVITRGL